MNIFEKMINAKIQIADKGLKKNGLNKFNGMQYYELSDIQYPVLKVCQEFKLCPFISFDKEYAYLTIVNVEKPEETIVIKSPMAEAQLKSCHQIQNMGAVETYQRRYLYLIAFDIVEDDILDKTVGKYENKQQGNEDKKIVEAIDKLDKAFGTGAPLEQYIDKEMTDSTILFIANFGDQNLDNDDGKVFNNIANYKYDKDRLKQECNRLWNKYK